MPLGERSVVPDLGDVPVGAVLIVGAVVAAEAGFGSVRHNAILAALPVG